MQDRTQMVASVLCTETNVFSEQPIKSMCLLEELLKLADVSIPIGPCISMLVSALLYQASWPAKPKPAGLPVR
jgi:hypothetical protein